MNFKNRENKKTGGITRLLIEVLKKKDFKERVIGIEPT